MKTVLKKVRTKLAPAVSFYRLTRYLFKVRHDAELRSILHSYLAGVPLCVFSEPWRWLRMLLTTRTRFQAAEQRPYAFYAPHLSASSFGQPDQISEFLEKNVGVIREEFDRVAPPEVSTPSRALVSEGVWNTFPLRRSSKLLEENIARCPQTWAIAKQCPLLQGVEGGVYFSIIYPDTHVRSHCGPSNLRYRYHLTIEEAESAQIRSGQEWRTWRQGKCLILDDSFEHEVRHTGEKRRVVLIIDCWHPDLTEKEREFLTHLHQIWRKPTRSAAEKRLRNVRHQAPKKAVANAVVD